MPDCDWSIISKIENLKMQIITLSLLLILATLTAAQLQRKTYYGVPDCTGLAVTTWDVTGKCFPKDFGSEKYTCDGSTTTTSTCSDQNCSVGCTDQTSANNKCVNAFGLYSVISECAATAPATGRNVKAATYLKNNCAGESSGFIYTPTGCMGVTGTSLSSQKHACSKNSVTQSAWENSDMCTGTATCSTTTTTTGCTNKDGGYTGSWRLVDCGVSNIYLSIFAIVLVLFQMIN